MRLLLKHLLLIVASWHHICTWFTLVGGVTRNSSWASILLSQILYQIRLATSWNVSLLLLLEVGLLLLGTGGLSLIILPLWILAHYILLLHAVWGVSLRDCSSWVLRKWSSAYWSNKKVTLTSTTSTCILLSWLLLELQILLELLALASLTHIGLSARGRRNLLVGLTGGLHRVTTSTTSKIRWWIGLLPLLLLLIVFSCATRLRVHLLIGVSVITVSKATNITTDWITLGEEILLCRAWTAHHRTS